MKVHHIAHYEYGRRPHSEMREKEFPTRWEAEKFCEEWSRAIGVLVVQHG
jgi:hypothetical protein